MTDCIHKDRIGSKFWNSALKYFGLEVSKASSAEKKKWSQNGLTKF